MKIVTLFPTAVAYKVALAKTSIKYMHKERNKLLPNVVISVSINILVVCYDHTLSTFNHHHHHYQQQQQPQ